MKMTEGIMGMSVAVEILDPTAKGEDIDTILDYFHTIDETFSTYKKTSQISRINNGILKKDNATPLVKKVLKLCEETQGLTHGYFNIHIESVSSRFHRNTGVIDPSGLVKGFAINEASKMLSKMNYKNFYVEIGGDIDIRGLKNMLKWKVGIKNPVDQTKSVKVLHLSDCGIATSGTYIRGNHIYDPIKKKIVTDVASLTVIGPDVYQADRMATAAFAMGEKGMVFLEDLEGFEAYMVNASGKEFETTGFASYL